VVGGTGATWPFRDGLPVSRSPERDAGEKVRMGDKMRVERFLIDDLATRDVNQDRVLLHQVQFAGADQSLGGGRQLTDGALETALEGLNPAQRSAATYGAATYGIDAEEGPPPLLIAAGAGTGKTKTLAHPVVRLILGGADPRRLLLLTFTRRAALEMTRRAQQILVASQRGRSDRTDLRS
jgi:hypothetical protein